jgi:glutathione synthase/RimK-type ligase-like ATP-grasp enzyme
VKPSISAGGRSSARFDPGEGDAAAELVGRIHAEGRTAMVQPFLGDEGETALVYLGGRYSHAVRRRVPLPPAGATSALYLDEELASTEPAPAEREVAERALALAPAELLYARVDLMAGVVLELELSEPSLYLAYGGGAADRFAAGIAAAVGP